MITRVMLFLVAVMFTVPAVNAQTVNYTADTNEVLRLIRKDKLDLVLVDHFVGSVSRGRAIAAGVGQDVLDVPAHQPALVIPFLDRQLCSLHAGLAIGGHWTGHREQQGHLDARTSTGTP